MAKLDEQVEFNCEIDSNPQSSIIWTLNDTYIYSYPRLIINSVRPESYGIYKCTASLKNFPKISSSVILVPPGPPHIQTDHVQYAYFGEDGKIECLFETEPKPEVKFYIIIGY